MSHIYRCSRCRTRNTFRRAVTTYIRIKHCRHCRHTHFYIDKERIRRKPCRCWGYHHAHRPGSPCCDLNPHAAENRAARAAGYDEFVERVWDAPGESADPACPF